jgi:hypothetical protein
MATMGIFIADGYNFAQPLHDVSDDGKLQGKSTAQILCTNLSCFVLPTRFSRLRATSLEAARQKLEAIVRSTFEVPSLRV